MTFPPAGPHRARRRFGQNFLHDPGVIARIVAAVAPRAGEHLVEIGPGRGALTAPLLRHGVELDAIELDRDLIAGLRNLAGSGRLRIHNADALAVDYCRLRHGDERLRLVGNLPYNIATPLLFRLLDQLACIRDMHFMVQKEVAERLAAGPGGRDYGRLSLMVQYRCEVRRLFTVGPGAFRPAPKVHSAFVRLLPRPRPAAAVSDEAALEAVIRQAFAQRRKTLRNALRGLLEPGDIAAAGIDPGLRPERLGLAEFARLAERLHALGGEFPRKPPGK